MTMAQGGGLPGLDWIAADWGTSALRLWAVGADGSVLARAASGAGMGGLDPDGYEPALVEIVGGWLPEARTVPVIVCGMAGARQGWREAAYRPVPCAPVAGGDLTPVATADRRLAVALVPGLSQTDPPDVMRGEETQLAGLAERLGPAAAIACLPGTHAKWARLEGGRVTRFATFMTGEAFALLAERSVLRHSVASAGDDREAFLAAAVEMLDRPQRLTAALFGIRATDLLGGAGAVAARSRLSGLLIGAELAATQDWWTGRTVHLVGAPSLATAYAEALAAAGARTAVEDAETLTLAGLAIARAGTPPGVGRDGSTV